jgi:hypothetical protein
MTGFWRMWLQALLWAIPVSYLVCAVGFSATLVSGMINDGHADSVRDYASAALGGFFVWGTLIFIGTCFILVPIAGLVIAVVRCGLEGSRARRLPTVSGQGLSMVQGVAESTAK